jgi:cation diffusion facilitator family transporter
VHLGSASLTQDGICRRDWHVFGPACGSPQRTADCGREPPGAGDRISPLKQKSGMSESPLLRSKNRRFGALLSLTRAYPFASVVSTRSATFCYTNRMHTTAAIETSCSARTLSPVVDRNERRTRWVVGLTAAMMVVELVAGTLTQSLALVADGWHMATHAGALGLAALAYWFARTRAQAESFTFGTGKVNALAGYTNAILLAFIAVLMLLEAGKRLLQPVEIHFAEALPVAVLGLGVNLVSMKLLEPEKHHGHHRGADDHNLRSAYTHVLADVLTSVLAIAALLGGQYAGLVFLDPLMAIVGSLIILRWSVSLCSGSARQLLDIVDSSQVTAAIRQAVEALDDTRIVDLHMWEIAPGHRGCIASLITSTPRPLDAYRTAILAVAPVEHLTVEVSRCPHPHVSC